MTDNQKKLVFEYCGWCVNQTYLTPPDIRCHPLDGSDMVEAVKIMKSREIDFPVFWYFSMQDYELKMSGKEKGYDYQFASWLFNPENFFSLMGEWLEVGKWDNSRYLY
jgi:hypothetical protein